MYKLIITGTLLRLFAICFAKSPKNTLRINNFTVEVLYRSAIKIPLETNIVISPLTIIDALWLMYEGATRDMRSQIKLAARIHSKFQRDIAKDTYETISVNTSTAAVAITNRMIINQQSYMERDYTNIAREHYRFSITSFDFTDKNTVKALEKNKDALFTVAGRLPNFVTFSYFSNDYMVMINGLHFYGSWTVPFNIQDSKRKSFHDYKGHVVGEVTMMHSRHTYALAEISGLQARVIELKYGVEGQFSMLIILPNLNVTVEDVLRNFLYVPLSTIFTELKASQHNPPVVVCFLPKFRIITDLVLDSVMKHMGVVDLFDPEQVHLPLMARISLFLSKMKHRAVIEVTEKGTFPPQGDSSTLNSDSSTVSTGASKNFRVDRPFIYLVLENVKNIIIASGIVRQPSVI